MSKKSTKPKKDSNKQNKFDEFMNKLVEKVWDIKSVFITII